MRCLPGMSSARTGIPTLPVVCFACALLVCSPVVAGSEATGLHYEVRWQGKLEDALRKTLEQNSDTVTYRDRLPASLTHLRRRVSRDVERFTRILHAQGYYDATIDEDISTAESPFVVEFRVDPGPQYTFRKIDVAATSKVSFAWPTPSALDLPPGTPALSKAVVDAEGQLLACAKTFGHPFPSVANRSVVVDRESRTVDVTYTIDPGPLAQFGPTTVDGLNAVKEETVRRAIAWQEGEPYDAKLISETQDRLYAQELYSMARVITGDTLDAEGRVPMRIRVVERKHRTISLGAGFDTDGGPNVRAGWEHRNIDGLGHKLTLQSKLSGDSQDAEARFLIPGWRRDDQTLRLQLRLGAESPEAYDSRYAGAGVTVERKLGPRWTVGAGVAFRYSLQEQKRLDEIYHLLSFPSYALRDTTDNSMDPKQGSRLDLRAEPFVEVTDPTVSFLRGSVEWRGYRALDEDGYWVIAARLKLGTILGAGSDAIPPDERFYAGGGGSIRGFAYKTVSPLKGDDPIGGRSLTEASIELRRRITEQLGAVVFVDAGNAFSTSIPDFGEELRVGAGVGVRYFTPIGPLRIDVAVPLNPREELDDRFGVYVSFGQAF